jgi:hypothetical protein
MKKLKTKYISHTDFHHNNMVMIDDKVLLLDLDHMKQYKFLKWLYAKAHQKDITQFMKYLGENIQAKQFFIKVMKADEDGSS